MTSIDLPIGLADVEAAAQRLRGHVVRTPLLYAHTLSERSGGRVFVKCENLQPIGAFKIRGAFNRLVQLDAAARRAGVVAFSSGNHAQGVAMAGRMLGIAATIVMPTDAPRVKVENTKALGADIIFYDRFTEDREAIARRFAAERGATIVPAYDDVHVMAGQGTVALEILEQLDGPLDALFVPCGGGGLTAGCATVMKSKSPNTAMYSVEPRDFDDHARSLRSGARVANDSAKPSICDALLAPTPGNLTWPINQRYLTDGLSVDDEQVLAAMRFAWQTLKLVVEPGGAVALAAVLHGLVDCRNRTVVAVLSGGNVDPQVFMQALT